MSIEQVEIPAFPPEPGDADLDDSLVIAPISGTKFTREQVSTIFENAETPPRKTYDEYLAAGKSALRVAISNEEVYGLAAAAHEYESAGTQFLGAISTRPILEGRHDDVEPDPVLLLEYATCIAKQAENGQVREYRRDHPLSAGLSRRSDLELIAKRTFQTAWQRIMSTPESEDETLLSAALVVADGLQAVNEFQDAKTVFKEAGQVLASHNADPKITGLFQKPSSQGLDTAHELAGYALLDLATDSHEILELV